jgi:cyclic beta-1,2-glucan synthetase
MPKAEFQSSRWKRFLNRGKTAELREEPLRLPLLAIEQLGDLAFKMGQTHSVAGGSSSDRLLLRVHENENVITRTHDLITDAAARHQAISPASEWLIDNFYVVQEQLHLIKEHFPRRYCRQLPHIDGDPPVPRIFDMMLKLISHLDGRVDIEALDRFIFSYQQASPLSLGELWAAPIMLRVGLIENLRRVSGMIYEARKERNLANVWADRLIEAAEAGPDQVIVTLSALVESQPPLESAFVAEFMRRLHGQHASLHVVLEWISQSLARKSETPERMVVLESQRQAADQVSMGNCFASFRFLDATDWGKFVERHSMVEHVLRQDPAQIYAQCDFATRDRARHMVEQLARRAAIPEHRVADAVIELARSSNADTPISKVQSHVGWYLLDDGVRQLERRLRVRPRLSDSLSRLIRRIALFSYLFPVVVIAAAITATWWLGFMPTLPIGVAVAGLAVMAMVAVQCAVSITNYFLTRIVSPKILPRLDYESGIDRQHSTCVVIPCLITDAAEIAELAESLEIKYLANRDPNLSFAVLSDFVDHTEESHPDDEKFLGQMIEKIDALNHRYGRPDHQPFCLFHRPRTWNASEKVWMGRERKRGKLEDFINLIAEGNADAFVKVIAAPDRVAQWKFILTLDADTQLPSGTAAEMIGTAAHLLNLPIYDPHRRRVVRGYTILQPRVSTTLTSSRQSLFARLFSGEPGIDPYTRAVSDVYQDLFGEGSFIGKGIIDVESFHKLLAGRLPENIVLSHDLLEGSLTRAGLVSDIMVLEDHPPTILAELRRRHRWVRGDWQLLPWVAGLTPPGPAGKPPVRLNALARWKLFDNLRRSLVPAATVTMFILAWTLAADPAWATVTLAILVIAPALLAGVLSAAAKSKTVPWGMHLHDSAWRLLKILGQSAVGLMMLPVEALTSLDAIARSLYRLLISGHHRLQWQTSRHVLRTGSTDLAPFLQAFIGAILLTIVATALVVSEQPGALPAALPLVVIWLAAPFIAWLLSRPIGERPSPISPADVKFLRMMARKTWRYFEEFVDEKTHFLPPDNVQEIPQLTVAPRTSPTNIGLALLANLAAFDFGWITQRKLLDRTAQTFDTLEKLVRYRGHFLNWYDTQSLEPLHPRYVSTVDSGNLAGHLFVLRSGLIGILREPIQSPQCFHGLQDTLDVLREAIETKKSDASGSNAIVSALDEIDDWITAAQQINPSRTSGIWRAVKVLRQSVDSLQKAVAAATADADAAWYAAAAQAQIQDAADEMCELMPWLTWAPDQLEALKVTLPSEALAALARLEAISPCSSLQDMHSELGSVTSDLQNIVDHCRDDASRGQCQIVFAVATQALNAVRSRIKRVDHLCAECGNLADMDFRFLYNPTRKLMTIGFNIDQNKTDDGYYDLLASEARLASYVGIVSGQLPREHWFALGRQLTSVGGKAALLSWSGSMFEYLMPLIVMPSYPQTLLHQSMQAAVERNIDYGRDRSIPWGVSESGYNLTDAQLNYQYKAFGVPGLGYRRRLSEDVVIAPYATMLALLVNPVAAVVNLRRLAQIGAAGRCGLFEAIDYTPDRIPEPGRPEIIRSFMAHHIGMGLLSLEACTLDHPMQKRFSADPLLKSGELLLQERTPRVEPVFPHSTEVAQARLPVASEVPAWRSFSTPRPAEPQVQLFSNGRYQLMMTAGGGGRSKWNGLALTRWRADSTEDHWGLFCYVKDVESGQLWALPYEPINSNPKMYSATFSEGKAEYQRRDGSLEQTMHVAVSPEDDVELRRITITNRGKKAVSLELTTYMEVVLAPHAADLAHRAFENLFVKTQIAEDMKTVFASRRPRRTSAPTYWMFQSFFVRDDDSLPFSAQTDRHVFLGRGRSVSNPVALRHTGRLSGIDGAVLDPIIAIRRAVKIAPEQTITLEIVVGAADSEEACRHLAVRYRDRRFTDRTLSLAWSHGQVLLRQLGAGSGDAQLFSELAGALIYPRSRFKANADLIRANRRGQSGLWAMGISGDLPIVLLRVAGEQNLSLVRQMIQAHAYWRQKGLSVDLVIWNQDASNYRQNLSDAITSIAASGPGAQWMDKPGGIFIRRSDLIAEEDRRLLQAAATISMSDMAGTMVEQSEATGTTSLSPLPLVPVLQPVKDADQPLGRRPDLNAFNGIGGFTRDGREYVMQLRPNVLPPAPWCNVIAGRRIGTVVSERGSMYTWVDNAHEYRLTPWLNDAVSDPTGEALYIRDDQTGRFWSPTVGAAGAPGVSVTRHGFGYTVFESSAQEIDCEMKVFCHMDEPVKFILIKLKNRSSRPRKLTVAHYVQWVLGESAQRTAPHIWTQMDVKSGAILARNAWNLDFGNWVAFAGTSEPRRSVTGDRTEFIGRSGSVNSPQAMRFTRLLGRLGAALDPCAATMCEIQLPPQSERELTFILGAAPDEAQAKALVNRFQSVAAAKAALEGVWWYWKRTLGTIYIESPDASLNALANGWLLYQTISSRIFGRSGYYQSGGAFGFRDQLQDAMAAALADPPILRAHLLTCASRQFEDGDVQHWWHPPTGRGVRTKFSDDFLWLPLAVARYVQLTGDTGVLDERVGFIAGPPVAEHAESWYDAPQSSPKVATLYEHAILALRRGMRDGPHGLPIIGCGDWNDGLNLVGEQGQGESVWLAFFQCVVFAEMAKVAQIKADEPTQHWCRERITSLSRAIEESTWDGDWYTRAFFDDGTPLGSHLNTQCQIDSLPQSWATIAGIGDLQRREAALRSVEQHLVDRNLRLIKLFDPPFDHPTHDPGYIAGYLPGVRENGGQYTHAAVWAIMAFALAGEVEKAWDLFQLINPINHGASADDISTYRVEPYVVAADVYTLASCPGRGGWTWYTGSAGWMYRLLVETFMGIRVSADRLWFEPRLPSKWSAFKLHYRYCETFYHITMEPSTDRQVIVDGVPSPDGVIHMINDQREHQVLVRFTACSVASGSAPADK